MTTSVRRSAGTRRAVLPAMIALSLLSIVCFPYKREDGVWKHPSYQGFVVDALTQEPLAGATVLWVEGRKSVATDDRGRFALPGSHGPPVGVTCFADQMEGRTILVTHPQYRDRRFTWRHVLFGDPAEDLGSVELTPRAAKEP